MRTLFSPKRNWARSGLVLPVDLKPSTSLSRCTSHSLLQSTTQSTSLLWRGPPRIETAQPPKIPKSMSSVSSALQVAIAASTRISRAGTLTGIQKRVGSSKSVRRECTYHRCNHRPEPQWSYTMYSRATRFRHPPCGLAAERSASQRRGCFPGASTQLLPCADA